MSIFATMLGLSADEYIKQADEFLKESRFGEAKIEYEKAEELVMASETEKKEYVESKIKECRARLCDYHYDRAKACIEAQEYEKAVSSYETALELSEENTGRNKLIHQELDHARIKFFQHASDEKAIPMIENGDAFMLDGSYNEALVEYREAMKILKYYQESEDELKKKAHQKLTECEIKIVEPYIERAKNFIETQMSEEALEELLEAREIVEEDTKTIQTIEKLIIEARKVKGQSEEAADEDFISKQEWDEAMDEYKELLNLYFSYTYNDSDPFYPIHRNKYESEFLDAKKKLGGLYCKRADGHFNQKKYAVALKYYVESEKFFEANSAEIKYIAGQIDQCKSNIK